MTNHLANESSPYLLQHADNPVDWYPWGDEALKRAREDEKPIFLSIGYAACHWCHVMAHESFENKETADFMNRHFVNIKVDREERPDLDSIYMSATQAMTGSGGWPMSVFLTPDLQPFYAGTYFPPVRRYNMPAFQEVLEALESEWRNNRDKVLESGQRITDHLQAQTPISRYRMEISQEHLNTAAKRLLVDYDWGYGGWGSAPKFPQPMTIEFLLRRYLSPDAAFKDAQEPLKACSHALQAMSPGGMYDVVGGGFSRYSTDNFWRVPHFEKMLYDNAQLARVYLHAWQITKNPTFKRIVEETLKFIAREMTNPQGGFYSSLDADSEGEEGKFYVWTAGDLEEILQQDYDFFKTAYGITQLGNWEGKTVLQRAIDDSTLASRFQLEPEAVSAKLANCHATLLAVREHRVRPGTDDKVLTAWNGLALATLAEAAQVLGTNRDDNHYLKMATRNADFLLSNLIVDGRLRRSWRNGKTTDDVFLEDYAALILGLIELYQTDFDVRWFSAAQKLTEEMVAQFKDPAGGFFDVRANNEALILRPKNLQDNATPSGNALACAVLLKMSAFTDRGEYRDLAEQILSIVAEAALQHPTAFSRWLSVADSALSVIKQIAIIGDVRERKTQELLAVVRTAYRPNIIAAASLPTASSDGPTLLLDRPMIDNQPTAYVCEGFVCNKPTTEIDTLRQQID